MRLKNVVRPVMVIGGLVAVATFAGAWAGRMFSSLRSEEVVFGPVDTAIYANINYDSATARVEGQVSAALQTELKNFAVSDSIVVVLVTAQDCLTCEDLGRQLRALARATSLPVVLFADSASSDVARAFLARERLGATPVLTLAPASVFSDGRSYATPAAIVVNLQTGQATGVSHTRRFKFIRLRSFAEELGLIQGESPDSPPIARREQ